MAEKKERTHQGDRIVWCAQCAVWFKAPGGWKPFCPKCGSPIRVFKCCRCGHEWEPRDPRVIPGTCPGCNSPYAFYTRVRAVARDPPKARPLALSIEARRALEAEARASLDPSADEDRMEARASLDPSADEDGAGAGKTEA